MWLHTGAFQVLAKESYEGVEGLQVLYLEQIHDAAHQPRKMWREVNKAFGHGHNGGISIIRSDRGATDIWRNLTDTSLLSLVPSPGKVDLQMIGCHIWQQQGRRQALYSAGLMRIWSGKSCIIWMCERPQELMVFLLGCWNWLPGNCKESISFV